MSFPVYYVVPYTVAATRVSRAATGRLRVLAESPADALDKAAAIHGAKRVPGTPPNGWAGPGASHNSRRASVSYSTLPKAMRDGFTYGEPIAVDPSPETRDVLGIDARRDAAIAKAAPADRYSRYSRPRYSHAS